MTKLSNPTPLFLDTRGYPMDGGNIYVGVADGDPETDPIDLFWDVGLTVPASQPLRTLGGYIVNVTTPSLVFCAASDFSMRVRDSNDVLVSYSPTLYTDAADFQPVDADLTTISGQANTPLGLALLTLANTAALKAATGIPDCLPLAGGTMAGNIVRSGAGVHTYWIDAAMTSGRQALTASGDPDPTTTAGDVWMTY